MKIRDAQKQPEGFVPYPPEGPSLRINTEIPPTPEKFQQERQPDSEKKYEQEHTPSANTEDIESTIEALKRTLRGNKKKKTVIPTVKDELTKRVEHVMEEGLGDAFRELTIVQQQEFKIKGEETAWKIRQILKKGHVKIKEIFKLLVEWLRLLPGINKFFIEQEAKIKADKILSLGKHHRFE